MRITIELWPAEIASGELMSLLQKMAAAEVATCLSDVYVPGPENNLPELPETAEAKQRRTRRTKAQIEADEAAAKNAATSSEALGQSQPQIVVTETPAPATPEALVKVTKEMISEEALMMTTDKDHPERKESFYAARKEFQISKLSDLKPAQYDAFYARLLALTAAPAAAAKDEL